MKTILSILILFTAVFAYSQELLIIEDEQTFDYYVQSAQAPIMVSFSASWCGACVKLKRTLQRVAQEYDREQVTIAYVDADKNTGLKKFLLGFYPTVRTFDRGVLLPHNFIGSKPYNSVKTFVNELLIAKDSPGSYCPISSDPLS